MDRYRVRKSRIFGGVFLLLLAGFVLWYIAGGILIYTPFAKSLGVRAPGGTFVKGTITELYRPYDFDDTVSQVRAEYYIGFQKREARLPGYIFYHEGLEVGDTILVPFTAEGFEDMTKDDKIVLTLSLIVFTVLFIWGVSLIVGELAASRYYRRLILNKSYINAQLEKTEESGNKARAVCRFNDYIFKSKWYSLERYPFKRGGDVRVYVDLLKNPEKYLVSEL